MSVSAMPQRLDNQAISGWQARARRPVKRPCHQNATYLAWARCPCQERSYLTPLNGCCVTASQASSCRSTLSFVFQFGLLAAVSAAGRGNPTGLRW